MSELVEVIESGHRCFKLYGAGEIVPTTASISTLVEWLNHTPGAPADLIIQTGSQYGPYDVTLRTVEGPPALDSSWEDVSEISVTCEPRIGVDELLDVPADWVEIAGGTYRVRVSARGRTESCAREYAFPEGDDGEDEDAVEEPLEHYLVEVWPAAATPPVVLREDSQFARGSVPVKSLTPLFGPTRDAVRP